MTDTAIPHDVQQGQPAQQAGGPGHEPLSELEHPTHKGDHDPAHHNDPEHVRKEIRRYLMVFGALAVLTIITVAISQLHLPMREASREPRACRRLAVQRFAIVHAPCEKEDIMRGTITRRMFVTALGVLTIITVAISQLHLPTHEAIILALVVATIKGSLVAAFFMHLLSERKLIYAVLALTVFFFGMMLWGPWHQRNNAQKIWPHYDLNASSPGPKTPAQPHGSGH